MDLNDKIDWAWGFLNTYWKYLFSNLEEIPDIESDSDSDDDISSDNEY